MFVRGALVWTGDSHAAHGNGEVNLTAMETAFQEITITTTVDKTKKLQWPRIETPTEWIAASWSMIKPLQRKGPLGCRFNSSQGLECANREDLEATGEHVITTPTADPTLA